LDVKVSTSNGQKIKNKRLKKSLTKKIKKMFRKKYEKYEKYTRPCSASLVALSIGWTA
jgi:hypothetical protein